ncbi:MAG: MgtC/SapB family protein [Runella slithyformis]|nr:MAG: MgtC/SapB family protein [Runella slithyformis]TAF97341.1 MAG: MgtC/SapB family protein [Runella sp.]TAG19839.1 MAG: MgtC/SapB family protein [Cytophagales bacterium]TAG39080.1 MAG: MgtC/SapB family protein [Cytophagia bacterium]TAF29454.1 MAG: MgtC/SapB family protein [Runella slithyformis]
MEFLPEDILKLLVAFGIGTVIGAEREYRSKSAGLRTLILISVGSTLFTIISAKVGGDAGRIAANIVTGIGFIGGGIIFRENSRVSGITTAASVWATAALGMAVGDGLYEIAIVGGALVILALYALVPVQNYIKRRNQIRNYRVVAKFQQKLLKQYENLFEQFGMQARRGAQTRTLDTITGNWIVQGSEKQHEKLIKHLLNDPQVIEFDF